MRPGRTRVVTGSRAFRFRPPVFGHAGATFGLLLLVLYPVLGNALVYGWPLPRRPFQAAVLLAGLACLWWSRRWLRSRVITRVDDRLKALLPRRLLAGVAGVIVVSAAANMAGGGLPLAGASLFDLLFFVPWLIVGAIALSALGPDPLTPPEVARGAPPAGLEPSAALRFGASAFVIGAFMALRGWWTGPEDLQAYMSFGGSTLIIGNTAAIACFIVLACTPFPLSMVWSAPYAYLIVMSTSRAAWVTFAALYVLYVVAVLAGDGGILRKLARAVLPAVVLWLCIFEPSLGRSCSYPYRVPDCDPVLIQYRSTEFWLRSLRIVRVIPFRWRHRWTDRMKVSLGMAGKTDAELMDENYRLQRKLAAWYAKRAVAKASAGAPPIIPRYDAEQQRLILLVYQGPDARFVLYKNTLELLAERPIGYWPVPFRQRIRVNCGDLDGSACKYPHNIILTFVYHFGVLTSFIVLAGFGLLALRMTWHVIRAPDAFSRTLVISFAGWAVLMQFSGDLPDYFRALLFGTAWLVLRGVIPARRLAGPVTRR